MAGHALYGMDSCFRHTGVTFDAENDRPGPSTMGIQGKLLMLKMIRLAPAASEVILMPPFFETKGFVLRL